MNVNFEHYKVFYYVARHGTITQAAQALYISQPAVSKSIHLLEKELSCELFHRNQKGMTLTPEGEMLYGHVAKAYEQLALGEKKLWEMLNLNNGVVRLGTSDMIARFFLLPYLEKFHSLYPDIRINMQSGTTPGTRVALKEERIEVGVVSSPVAASDDIEIYPIREIQDVFVAGLDYAPLAEKVLSFEEIMAHPIICTERNTASRHYLDTFFLKHKIHLELAFELGTMELIMPYAERNLGIGIAVRDVAQERLEQGSLIEIRAKVEMPKRQICVIKRKKGGISKAAEAFLDIILP